MELNEAYTDPPTRTRHPVEEAYRIMKELRYRPAAPSDGFGHIVGALDLRREIEDYRRWWAEEEDSLRYDIGVGDYSTMVPLVLTIEGARCLCGVQPAVALRLLRRAVEELERCLDPDPQPVRS